MRSVIAVASAMLAYLCLAEQTAIRDHGIEMIGHITARPDPPKWPNAFETIYSISLPYVETIQAVGLK